MKDLFIVTKFTMKDMLQRKSFIITTIIFLIMIVVGFNIPNFMKMLNKDSDVNKIEIIDSGNVFEGTLESLKDLDTGYEIQILNEDYEKIKEKIENEEIDSAIIVEKQDENIKISDIIKPNQKLLVQIKKDSNEKKGARVSTHINLPSKYIVLMPNTEIITVSQKIESEEEQKRLVKLVKENLEQGNGAIIRTSAQGKEKEIIEDIKNIQNKWNKIIETGINPNQNNPKLLYKSEDIIDKMLMDMTDKEISIKRGKDIFNTYDINKQIEKIQNRKIWLKCGGFITIDKTEALTAIDVNTGKYTGNKSLRQTILRVNQEATIEIAKQLRLRDIGGIIIIDYIDMKNQEDREIVEELLKEELKKDRTKTQVEGFTKLDLMEMTRKHICSHKE